MIRLLTLITLAFTAAFTVAFLSFSSITMAQVVEGDDAPLRFGRFVHQGEISYGFLSVGGVHQLDRSFLEANAWPTGKVFGLDVIGLLAPVKPGKVIGIALNYKSHGGARSKELQFFAKLPSSVIASGGVIIPPYGSTNLHYEGEMVIVMGGRAKNVSVKEAGKYIFGVTVGNDVTERGFPFSPFDVLRSKGSDTLAPLGPWIVPGLSYDRLQLVTRLNGKVVQKSSTAKMIFSSAEIVARLSRYITLEPGDVIYTGTPGATAALKTGDVVEVSLEGVGILKNTVGNR